MAYWRDNFFARTIIYLLPFCLIALLPGLYWTFVIRLYALAVVDVLAIIGMLLIAFFPGINLATRKIIFIACIYIFSCALLFYAGLSGPGLVYPLTASVLCVIIFPDKYAFWPAWLNLFICLFFTVALLPGFITWPQKPLYSPGEWVAISSNLVFLSFLLAALIPQVFKGLQETINMEQQLKETLNSQQQSLQLAMDMLQQKNNELEQFTYMASHDMKEPLRMVNSFMGLVKEKYGNQLDEKAHTYIDFALDGGKRMQQLIDDLLELSRTARNDRVKEPADMSSILKEVEQNLFKMVQDRRAEIIVKTALPVLSVYRADIVRLLQNLISNAIKFSRKDVIPVIWLSTAEQQGEWLFIIEDNGIGIEQEKFEKIFEIFTRLHSYKVYEGTGIGLAVCKKVVEHHRGRIWLESEEGKGSTFYFTLEK
jgi:signal transduction histidine kinase